MADDDDENFGSKYENGVWVWDDNENNLIFISTMPKVVEEMIPVITKAHSGTIEFREDIDLVEQLRYRRRYQRKIKNEEPDVITIQDVKDVAIYTAPVAILSPVLIDMLHIPTTERFIRALILFCQYYLQITEEMSKRMAVTLIRTPVCDIQENEYKRDLCDLKVLVAKEYCIMLIGGSDTKRFHHMGANKKRKSLSDKDARFFETFIRICVQIVWLALGRKSFNTIELEVNRLFKSEIFNRVEHTLRTGYITKMTPQARNVLVGKCIRYEKKLATRSPFMNEVFCERDIDFRMMGLGVLKFSELTDRFRYMKAAIRGPESDFQLLSVSLGILGLSRKNFDVMLHPHPFEVDDKSKSKTVNHSGSGSIKSRSFSKHFESKRSVSKLQNLYPKIVLPKTKCDGYFPETFPDEAYPPKPCNEEQKRRWQKRLAHLLHPT